MPHKHKGPFCLNCQQRLDEEDNFCKVCGQENDNRNISFWQLAVDFLEENLGIDSKIARSLIPFLISPGKLTVSFISGQRKRYIPPLRMYLTLSVICFLLLSLTSNEIFDAEKAKGGKTFNSEQELRVNDSLEFVTERKDHLKEYDSLYNKAVATKDLEDVEKYREKLRKWDTAKFEFDSTVHIDLFNGNGHIRAKELNRAHFLMNNFSDSVYVDSIGWDNNWVTRRIIHQIRRLSRNGSDGINIASFMVENASPAAFMMVPLLALWLKLMYIRRRIKYITHLVHVLHIQSFLFLLGAISIGTDIVFKDSTPEFLEDWKGNFVIFATLIYAVISIRVVYQQGWLKSIVKTFLGLIGFVICIILVVVPLTAISFLSF